MESSTLTYHQKRGHMFFGTQCGSVPHRRSDGGLYRYIYTQKISNRFVHVWDINTCFEIAMTS